jgi:hypothetical protein
MPDDEETKLGATIRPTLVVDIRLRSPEAGGRSLPIISSYRPIFRLHNEGKQETIGLLELTIPDAASIEPGGSGRAIVLMSPEVRKFLLENVALGDTIEICEGNRVVGEAEVIKFLD